MTRTGTDAYLETQVMTATPEKLQLMLYEGAIRFATQAKERILEGNFEASHERLVRAQRIILELMCGLKPELNPELCGRLSAVYGFIYSKFVEANVRRDISAVDAALRVLSIQRDIWLEVLDKLSEERSAQMAESAAKA